MQDLIYVAVAIAFFVGCDAWLARVDERKSDVRR